MNVYQKNLINNTVFEKFPKICNIYEFVGRSCEELM